MWFLTFEMVFDGSSKSKNGSVMLELLLVFLASVVPSEKWSYDNAPALSDFFYGS
ncbi:MAG TPA: hypothetical protein PKU94_04110 [Candidatus Hydrothermia bacterium]|nr:hypothetical protein [Candidatus Hydrothermia bacterium]